jgi:hypothetical protein
MRLIRFRYTAAHGLAAKSGCIAHGPDNVIDSSIEHAATPPRPGDFARILLAAGGGPPRARARDQQADQIGESIRNRVLNRLVALDPEPDGLESTLAAIIAETDEPSGATRAVCTAILQEWQMIGMSPSFWPFLIGQAIEMKEGDAGARRKRRDRSD